MENKYKTLSKANSGAISDVENYKQENKKLRAQLHDATTSKSSELLELRDKLEKMTQGRLEKELKFIQDTAYFTVYTFIILKMC